MFETKGTSLVVVAVFLVVFLAYVVGGSYYVSNQSGLLSVSGPQPTSTAAAIAVRAAEPTQVALTYSPTPEESATPTPISVRRPASTSVATANSSADSELLGSGSSREYTVKAGDNLNSIATVFGLTVDELLDRNPTLRNSPDSLQVGQVLLIPSGAEATAAHANEVDPTEFTATPEPWIVYYIEPGDTLQDVANRFGTTVDTIIRVNDLRNPDQIAEGQRLLIPAR